MKPEHFFRCVCLCLGALLGGCASLGERAESPEAIRGEAEAALTRGNLPTALALLRQAIELAPDDVGVWHLLARLHEVSGDREGERAASERILSLHPDDVRALERLGLLALQENRLAEAKAFFLRTIELDAGRWRSLNGLGVITDTEGRYAEAEAHYRDALELMPGHPKLLANLGWSSLLRGSLDAAETLLRESLEILPDSVVTRSNLAFCVALKGRYEEALTLYAGLYEASVAANNVGYAALVRHDEEAAGRFLRQAIQSRPSYYGLAANNLSLLQQHSNGGEGQALMFYSDTVSLDGGNRR